MTSEDNGNGKVTYTIREMFAEIKTDLKSIDAKLENKAERSNVDGIDRRLSIVETQRLTEREIGQNMLAEYRTFQAEHSALRTDVATLKSSKRDFAVWGAMLINFVAVLAALVKLFQF